ncbi:hypothetical protein BKA70DRAFT_1394532, partial [Coprinopsis sp. MPI-PUGE-AT-0042]
MSTVRKSSRLQTKEITGIYAEPRSDDESVEGSLAALSSDDDLEEAPNSGRSKRKRSGKSPSKGSGRNQRPLKRRRGNRGLLEKMTDLPMDLLFEVFGKLDPLDLLHLSRTTKALRDILMSRSSIAIWKECLRNSGLPPCPDDMNEPQWADLAFGKHCQVCLRAVPQHLAWDARVRACSRCVESTLFSHHELETNNLPRRLLPCVPSIEYQTTGRRRREVRGYHLATVRKWIAEYADVAPSEGDAWIDARILESEARDEHTELCVEWHAYQLNEKEEKANADKDARISIIITKLENAGFSDSIEAWRTTPFWNERPVRELLKKEITERGTFCFNLSSDFGPDVALQYGMAQKTLFSPLATQYRRDRIDKEHRATIKTRHELLVQIHSDYSKTQPINSLIIPVADLFKTSEVKAVFESVPFDRDMTVEDFSEVVENIPLFTKRWIGETKDKLLEMAKAHLTSTFAPEPFPDSALDL